MNRKDGLYCKYIKRVADILLSLTVLIVFCWLYCIIAIFVKAFLGSPVIYKAKRAGRKDPITGIERTFQLYKFRSMTNEMDEKGNLLPATKRLTRFGRLLRSTSLDELPEVFNILLGDMSFVGPRPLGLSYLPYYSAEERHRHDVRPGLTGLAQVKGRNNLSWEAKFGYDLDYINRISFRLDIGIILETVIKVFKREGIGQGKEMPVSLNVERSGKNVNSVNNP